MSPRSPKMTRRQKLMAFGPALLVIGATAIVASGASIISSATAASTVTVTGSVTAGMSTDVDTADGNCGGAGQSLAFGGGQFGDGAFHSTTGLCELSFATNSTTGSTITVADADGAAPFFCTGGVVDDNGTVGDTTDDFTDCASVTGNETVSNVAGNTIGDDEFGVALEAVAGAPAPTAAGGRVLPPDSSARNAGSESEAIWHPITSAGSVVCSTIGQTTTTQECHLAFGLDGKGATQTAGAYAGTANIIATAL